MSAAPQPSCPIGVGSAACLRKAGCGIIREPRGEVSAAAVGDDMSDTDRHPSEEKASHPTRREFVTTSAALGLAAASGVALGAERAVIEKDVEVRTADGICDAAFIHPAAGAHPGVLIDRKSVV